ncbi:MAG: RloB family protein [Prevotella sp.]|jgi:hypothetical protein|nr:RloB family protein [Prevotella sp.]
MRTNKKISQSPKSVFSFVVDGECEFWYLQMLKDYEKSLKINLSPEIYKKKTLEEQYKRISELAEYSTKAFWIIDLDNILKETIEARRGKKTSLQVFQELYNKCKKDEKIIIIVNNPCFEFWVLLHFCYTNRFYESYKVLLSDLQKYLVNYEKTEKYFVKSNPDIYRRLKPHLETAIINTQKLGAFNFYPDFDIFL